MDASKTGEMEAVHLEHLHVPEMSKLNSLLGVLKQLFRGNARITLTVNGGHIEGMEPCQVLKIATGDLPPPKTVA